MSLGGSCKALYINFFTEAMSRFPYRSIETPSLPTLAHRKPSTTECYFAQDPLKEATDQLPTGEVLNNEQ